MSDKTPKSKSITEYIILLIILVAVFSKYRWNGFFLVLGFIIFIFLIIKFEEFSFKKRKAKDEVLEKKSSDS